MKSHSLLLRMLPILALALVLTGTSHAQISWGAAQDMSDSSDISTTGTFFDAVTNHSINGDSPTIGTGASATTFNDLEGSYTQTSNTAPYDTGGDGKISITKDNTANSADFPTSDTTYQDAIGFGAYTNAGESGTISLSGLSIGQIYQVQVFSYYPDSSFSPVLSGIDPVTLNCGTAQYALGTFTAQATSLTFDYGLAAGSQGALLNAIAVRDITAEVPEPSTWLMLGAGVVFLAWGGRRRLLV